MSNPQLVLTIIFSVILFIAVSVVIGWLVLELLKMKKRLERYKGISDLEAEQDKVKSDTNKLRERNDEFRTEQVSLKGEEAKIRSLIAGLRIQSYGLYEPKYDFGSSERYNIEIDKIRQ